MVEQMCCDKCIHQVVCKYWLEAKRITDSTPMNFTFHCDQFMESAPVTPKVIRRPIRKAAK